MTAIVWRASRAFELRSRHATRAIDLRRMTFQAHAPSKSIATMMTAAISKTADLILRQHCFQKFVLYIVSTSCVRLLRLCNATEHTLCHPGKPLNSAFDANAHLGQHWRN